MITFNIRTKLFIVIVLTCSVTVMAALGFFRFQFQRTYLAFVQEQEEQHLTQLSDILISYYAEHGSWQALQNNRRNWFLLQRTLWQADNNDTEDLADSADDPHSRPPIHNNTFSATTVRDIRRRTILLDGQRRRIQGMERDAAPEIERSLQLNGQIIGYLVLYKRQHFNNGSEDAKFVESQSKTLLIVALATLLGSMLVAWLVARQLVKPIHRLRQGAGELADGQYATRIKTVGRDELGQLSTDFNQLAERLQHNEQARRQWIMDIAHELRTPLSVLRGEIEAIQDGISQADTPTVNSLHQETLHLQRLVEDLYALSMSDNGALSYHKQPVELVHTLSETLEQFEPQCHEQGLTLDTHGMAADSIYIQADPQRLQQLFQNLIKNSLRYTDAPGTLYVSLKRQQEVAEIIFQDTAPGVPDESLPRLFERLYRVEHSRNRATGGAGIGLSICHNIVNAHGGSIQASHAEAGGLKITIHLPIHGNKV